VDAPELIIDTPEAGIATFVLNRPAELNAWTYTLEESEGVQAFRERRPPRFAPLLGGTR
jgi:1,4-dihydroxy-2-naphthoyl-CoA synthase